MTLSYAAEPIPFGSPGTTYKNPRSLPYNKGCRFKIIVLTDCFTSTSSGSATLHLQDLNIVRKWLAKDKNPTILVRVWVLKQGYENKELKDLVWENVVQFNVTLDKKNNTSQTSGYSFPMQAGRIYQVRLSKSSYPNDYYTGRIRITK